MANPFKRLPRSSEFPDTQNGVGGFVGASPWADNSGLSRVIVSELIGAPTDGKPDRALAMTLPAVNAVRNALIQTVGSLPLRAFDRDLKPLDKQPLWLSRTNDEFQSAYDRTIRTLDDFLFSGVSLWEIVETGVDGFPLDAYHVPLKDWQARGGRVYIRNREALPGTYIYFVSPFPGLLNVAGRTISHYLALEQTVLSRSLTPNPLFVLGETEDTGATDEQIQGDMSEIRKALMATGGGVIYRRYGFELDNPSLPEGAQAFLLEARNAVTTDIAKFTGIPSALLEGTASIDSLTYTTERGQQSRFLNFSLRQWADPIQERLSLNDTTPNGTRILFDLTELLGPLNSAGLDSPEVATQEPVAPAPTPEEVSA